MSIEDEKSGAIQETVSSRVIEALMSNYRDAHQAFLELIDNAVDNREANRPLEVRIRVSRDELSIYNRGGKGLDFDGLQKFFAWGYSAKTTGQIGFFGVGGKAAMGYLGGSMEVVCSADGANTEYRICDPSWESRKEGEWKTLTAETRRAVSEEGYFRVRVSNLKREVSVPALAAKLGDIYRPLLLSGETIMSVNNKRVEPLQIQYLEANPDLKAETLRVQTRLGDWFIIKLGVLAEGQKVKPGIRCYYRGRLIDEEQFFGHPLPTQLPQMQRLIGEAHLDFVPVTTNKTSFNRSSVQYDAVSKRIQVLLTPWVEKLAQLKFEQTAPVEGFERDLAREAKRVLEHVFASTGLVTKKMLPEGLSSGRLPPTKIHAPSEPTGKPGGQGPKEGQTAPLLEATIGEIRRWGALFAFEPRPSGTYGKRAEVVKEGTRTILIINSDYPLYQAFKRTGNAALGLYMAETAIMKICELVAQRKSITEYLDLADQLTRDCSLVYQTRLKGKTGVDRGTIHF